MQLALVEGGFRPLGTLLQAMACHQCLAQPDPANYDTTEYIEISSGVGQSGSHVFVDLLL
ncbi:hypothetical protein D3C72_2420380 [compost metagenome]